jgi:hypothetical protein
MSRNKERIALTGLVADERGRSAFGGLEITTMMRLNEERAASTGARAFHAQPCSPAAVAETGEKDCW